MARFVWMGLFNKATFQSRQEVHIQEIISTLKPYLIHQLLCRYFLSPDHRNQPLDLSCSLSCNLSCNLYGSLVSNLSCHGFYRRVFQGIGRINNRLKMSQLVYPIDSGRTAVGLQLLPYTLDATVELVHKAKDPHSFGHERVPVGILCGEILRTCIAEQAAGINHLHPMR